eukprot:TRINITY_DN21210_c0_g1_i1.p1 TRINITY_DN21210_c0_g1~~TRINITY_DN21210_c0_g1_i1.p1  ORF type:complete len:356 (-),score=81.04 TRINITY_DN21210_c0_g1_i1:23-1090(-)
MAADSAACALESVQLLLASKGSEETCAALGRLEELLQRSPGDLEDALIEGGSRLLKCLCRVPEDASVNDDLQGTAETLLELAGELQKNGKPDKFREQEYADVVMAPSTASREMLQKAGILAEPLPDGGSVSDVEPYTAKVAEGRQHRSDWKKSPVPLMVWPASRLLCELVLSMPEHVRDAEILEVGAGAHGLVAMAAAHAGAASVLATDADEEAVARMRSTFSSAASQHNRCRLEAAILNWKRPEQCEAAEDKRYKLILGSDVVHLSGVVEPLLATVRRFLDSDGVLLMINAAEEHRYGIDELRAALQVADDFDTSILPIPSEMVYRLGECDQHNPDMQYELYRLRWRQGMAAAS